MKYLKGIDESMNFNDWNEEEINYDDNSLTNKNFVEFLKDNNIYDQFIYNLKNYNSISLDDYCYKIYITSYILDAFSWKHTKEGYDFWDEMSDKWIKYLKGLNESIDFNDWEEEEFNENDSPLTDKEFVKFLKDNNIYDKFIYNCTDNKLNKFFEGTYWKSLETFCTDLDRKKYIIYSFDWRITKEKFGFWAKISDKWKKYYLNESIDFEDWDDEEIEIDSFRVGDKVMLNGDKFVYWVNGRWITNIADKEEISKVYVVTDIGDPRIVKKHPDKSKIINPIVGYDGLLIGLVSSGFWPWFQSIYFKKV